MNKMCNCEKEVSSWMLDAVSSGKVALAKTYNEVGVLKR